MGEDEDVPIQRFVVSLSFDVHDWIKSTCKQKTILSLTDIISKFLEYGNSHSQTYEDTLQELTITLKKEGLFMYPLISGLRESHHALGEDSIGNTHPHDENNTLIVPPLIEDGEPK